MMYKAFISYSRSTDRKFADALLLALKRLARPWHGVSALRVFLDRASLSASPSVWRDIEKVLADSEYLIVLCSRSAAESIWVEKEIRTWLSKHSPRRLILVLTDGNLHWDIDRACFDMGTSTALPPVLFGHIHEMPNYLDFRGPSGQGEIDSNNPDHLDKAASLVAILRGLSKEQVYGIDFRERRKAFRWMASGAGILLFLLAAAILSLWQSVRMQRLAEERRQTVEARSNSLVRVYAKTLIAKDPTAALAVLKQHSPAGPDQGALRILASEASQSGAADYVLDGRLVGANGIALSDDGNTIAVIDLSGLINVWKLRERKHRIFKLDVWAKFALSPNGNFLALSTRDSCIHIYDSTLTRRLTRIQAPSAVTDLAFSRDGKILVVAGSIPGNLDMEALGQGKDSTAYRPIASELGAVNRAIFSQDGRHLALASDSLRALSLVDLQSGTERIQKNLSAPLVSMAFSPDGSRLAGVSLNSALYVWNLATGAVLMPIPTRKSLELAESLRKNNPLILESKAYDLMLRGAYLGFVQNGKYLLTADEGFLFQWDPDSIDPVREDLLGKTGLALGVSPRGRYSAVESFGKLLLTDWSTGETSTISKINFPVAFLAFSQDESVLAAVGVNGQARVWNLDPTPATRPLKDLLITDFEYSETLNAFVFRTSGGKVITRSPTLEPSKESTLISYSDPNARYAFSPDGSMMAMVDEKGTVAILDLKDGSRRILATKLPRIRDLTFMGNRGFGVAFKNSLRFWNLRTGKISRIGDSLDVPDTLDNATLQLLSLGIKYNYDGSFAASPDGSLAAWARDEEHPLRIAHWLEDSLTDTHLECNRSSRFAFSPDNRQLAAATGGGSIEILDLNTRKTTIVSGHTLGATSIRYSPRGTYLISTGVEPGIQVFDPRTGKAKTFPAPEGGDIRHHLIDADETTLLTWDHRLMEWDLESGENRTIPCHDERTKPSKILKVRFLKDRGRYAVLNARGEFWICGDDLPRDKHGLSAWLARRTPGAFTADTSFREISLAAASGSGIQRPEKSPRIGFEVNEPAP